MTYTTRLNKAFEGAPVLPLNHYTKYVLFSDCHRGVGTTNDNFLKNRYLYLAALQHYYQDGFTYIELGDGDELWENRSMKQIVEAHDNIFSLLNYFYKKNRLYLIYGNHDMVKKKKACPLLPCLHFVPGIILQNTYTCDCNLYLTHGHQADIMNSTFWLFTRFLVRYFWKPLEHYGIPDPTSAARNYTKMRSIEKKLQAYATRKNITLITGHTHRPMLSEEELHYCNCGSCVHPYSITCIEVTQLKLSLIKWTMSVRPDNTLFVSRETLSGPFPLLTYSNNCREQTTDRGVK